PQYLIGSIAELEDVAGHALDGEILVDRADELVLRLQEHAIVGIIGNRTPGGQRGEPRAAASAQLVVDGVVMDERAPAAATRGEAFAQHRDEAGEILARGGAIGPGATEEREQLILVALARSNLGDDLLRQHVERLLGDRQLIELAAPHGIDERRALD